MSYLVLARKYRPKTFEDLVGQDSVAKGLTQAIKGGRIGHAFLFVGSRGTGKTSSARILARALNCTHGPTPTPCGECDSCRAIEEGSDVDVLEIDAASNNGVENVRELRESIAFRPMRGRFRITILDEVHMLSAGAFNALLKTLEEPPPHAKFIFATTAPEKIPDTIRSRCQVFEFRRIEEKDIVGRLAHVCQKENVTVTETVLTAIARAARGGMRDSLSLLDQLLAYGGASPTEEDLAAVTGAAGRDSVVGLAASVLRGERAALLQAVASHVHGGGEALELLDQLAEHFRNLLTIQLCGEETELVVEMGSHRDRLVEQAKSCDPDRCEAIVRHLVFARERARSVGPLARAAVESALLAASRAGEVNTVAALLARLDQLERRLAGMPSAPAASAAGASGITSAPAPAPVSASAPSPAPPVSSAGPEGVSAEALLDLLASKNAFGRALKESAARCVLEGGNLRISLRPLDGSRRTVVTDNSNRAAAERALRERIPELRLVIEPAAGGEAAPSAVAPQATSASPPVSPTRSVSARSTPAPRSAEAAPASPASAPRRDPSAAVRQVLELDPGARILGHFTNPTRGGGSA
ncbi:MAG: DNA polymerase III subunit gamma/tau [Planctomycetes bacterium]|nr:DNA polymerase III subunit gamma/tau [Planctomycetota bacterium]